MQEGSENNNLTYLQAWLKKKHKTITAENILSAGGVDAFIQKVGKKYSPDSFKNLSGDVITENELMEALKILSETK